MNNIFYTELNKILVTYNDLIIDINKQISYLFISRSSDYYLTFRNIIISLINNTEIIIIDSDLSDIEIKSLNIQEDDINKKINCTFNKIKDEKDLLERIKNANNWSLTIYTSGTTGVPKKVTHTFLSLTKAVKVDNNKSDDIWGFAYNPTHIAGIQVFFQALLNLNQIVRLFQISNNDIYSSINNYQITNISATPTYYRLLVNKSEIFTSVKRLTFGGEVFDENLISPLQIMFPNAKILNIYASTEIGTLFISHCDEFTVQEELKNKIKIINGELYVLRNILGKLEGNDNNDEWYKTNDKVEILSNEPLKIKFVGRINETINVGGYKVFPVEIEKIINNIPGVRNCVVYGKKNSVMGNLICCDIEKESEELNEELIFNFLKSKLQPYKIPRIIKFVSTIKTTRTGKVTRL
ncbi:MAG TPA: AMP-binding protein [Ignavibacteriaceae bacterium]|nr:AMP-binding protein [Ignavibacteriaceae bacterium]